MAKPLPEIITTDHPSIKAVETTVPPKPVTPARTFSIVFEDLNESQLAALVEAIGQGSGILVHQYAAANHFRIARGVSRTAHKETH